MPIALPLISTNVRSFAFWKLLRLRFRLGGLVAPAATVERASALFCTPYPGTRERALAAPTGDARLDVIDAGGHALTRYTWGEPTRQPYVLFAHGWSSHGARVLPWVQPLRDAGYAVVAFDQPAHGRSEGRQSNLYDFTERLLDVGRLTGPAAAVIGHSLGGAAAGLALARGLQAERAVLVAAAADPVDAGRRFARRIGLSEGLRRRMYELFETRLSIRFDEMMAERNAPAIDRPALIVHDLADREVPWCEGERWARHWRRARLLDTRGLGHHRILGDPEVLAAVLRFLDGDAVGDRLVSSPNLAHVA
ncbi:hydrolase [Lysobacter arseniciresistens ZS79]|uniref:Hydrolase n=1 Tax=Lysobacter arseniciresistens ZS79 TaxID=913325 RepID=A0A0A0F5K8_9GAMM|nr:alpha/beta fold hydrolase [Lysobacter arseniciresistens]KGM57663.1 hydrolase [Lysobacter arseniciresistens ZS79]